MDTQACSNILIPNIPLELSGRYAGSMTYEQITWDFNIAEGLPFIDLDEDGFNDIDPADCEEQIKQLQGQTMDIAWDFQPETFTSGTAVLYAEDEESGELEPAEEASFSYDVQGTRVTIELVAYDDPSAPIELQGWEMSFEGDLSMSDQSTDIRGTFLYSLHVEDPKDKGWIHIEISGPWSVSQPRGE